MRAEQIALVQQSFARVTPAAPQIADTFYDRLFEIAPGTRLLFPQDMGSQKHKLMAMLATAVNGLTRLGETIPAVRALGRRHLAYGAQPDHYPAIGNALLYALEQHLGEEWSEDLAAAWSAAYALLSQVMIDAAKEEAA